MFVQYVRDRKGHKVGVVVGLPKENNVGFSLCKTRPTKNDSGCDNFSKDIGVQMAIGRAKSGKDYDIPHSCLSVYNKMKDRITRYNIKNQKDLQNV